MRRLKTLVLLVLLFGLGGCSTLSYVAQAAGGSLLCQGDLGAGMVVPPGEGLLDFVRSLMGRPIAVGALRADYDDRALIDEMLSSLLGRGFAHLTAREAPYQGLPSCGTVQSRTSMRASSAFSSASKAISEPSATS